MQRLVSSFRFGRTTTALRIVLASSMCLLASHAIAEDNQPPADQAQTAQAPDASAPTAQATPAAPVVKEEAQPYVGRFLIYTGFMFLDSPKISLFEPGIHVQTGMRWSRHISVGFDYSRGVGDTAIGLGLSTPALQKEVDPLIAFLKAQGVVPQSYVAALPIHSVTQTFTGGPEFPWRRWRRFTPYIRPSCGFIYEQATVTYPSYLTSTEKYLLTTLVKQIAPTGGKTDTVLFYGVGGGVGFNVTKHFGLVVQADLVHDHLFNDLLATGRNTVRFSIGPGYQFGGNVTRKFIFH